MTIKIGQSIFDQYSAYMDYMLEDDNWSRTCTIYFPPIKEACSNCVNLAGQTSNAYQSGGPAPFSFNSCQYCGGDRIREKEVTDTIRLRIYWQKRDWVKTGNISLQNAACMVVGKKEDLHLLLKMSEIELVSEETTLKMRYTLEGQPFFHGLGKKNYFIAYLKS